MRTRWDAKKFIEAAKKIHGDKYDYSLAVCTGKHCKVQLICPVHGVFTPTANNHLRGGGCQLCARAHVGRVRSLSRDEFLSRIPEKIAHYDYSHAVYKSKDTPVTVICQTHGEFTKTPNLIWRGQGCPHCFHNSASRKARFVEKAVATHGNKYDYTNTIYSYDSVTIRCPTHGDFSQRSSDHIQGTGCPKCTHHRSRGEEQLATWLTELGVEFEVRNRKLIAPKELDIYIPSLKLAFEFNGLYYHSNAVRSEVDARNLHKVKSDIAMSAGVRVVHIFGDTLMKFPDAVKLLVHKLTNNVPSVGARSLSFQQVTSSVANAFLSQSHVQGGVSGGTPIGMYFKDSLVGVAVFSRRKSARGSSSATEFELVRFASTLRIVGGLQRSLAFFKSTHPECASVVSYVDLSMFSGVGYKSAGFVHVSSSIPDYRVVTSPYLERMHKSNFTRAKLAKKLPAFDPALSERENCLNNGIYRVYDCGIAKYVYTFP